MRPGEAQYTDYEAHQAVAHPGQDTLEQTGTSELNAPPVPLDGIPQTAVQSPGEAGIVHNQISLACQQQAERIDVERTHRRPLPVDDHDADVRGFERVLTEWDSVLFGVDVHLRTITRDGWVCSTYQAGYSHDGTEGELYDLASDPQQRTNRWDDPACAALRSDLLADLWDHQPPTRSPRLRVAAPV